MQRLKESYYANKMQQIAKNKCVIKNKGVNPLHVFWQHRAYIYIYIYKREKEREREREIAAGWINPEESERLLEKNVLTAMSSLL